MTKVVTTTKVTVIVETHFSVKAGFGEQSTWTVKKKVKIESRISAWRIQRMLIHSFIQRILNDYCIPDNNVLGLEGISVNK